MNQDTIDREKVKRLLKTQKQFESVRTTAAPILALANRPDTSIRDLSVII